METSTVFVPTHPSSIHVPPRVDIDLRGLAVIFSPSRQQHLLLQRRHCSFAPTQGKGPRAGCEKSCVMSAAPSLPPPKMSSSDAKGEERTIFFLAACPLRYWACPRQLSGSMFSARVYTRWFRQSVGQSRIRPGVPVGKEMACAESLRFQMRMGSVTIACNKISSG
ncbi:hypothetical protein LY76DRAFT_589202 [Colletotrichum caudatum]|nr:hypothetical protein LY76DRAFT_589202 [Colletotrichum caudatum]